jgi:hypothetical protein
MNRNILKLKTARGPLLAFVLVLTGMLVSLRRMGRVWWCDCGEFRPWDGDMWSVLLYPVDAIKQWQMGGSPVFT